MSFTAGKETEVLGQWSFKSTVEFTDLPPEKAQAYWATLQYFAEILFADLIIPTSELGAIGQEEVATFME